MPEFPLGSISRPPVLLMLGWLTSVFVGVNTGEPLPVEPDAEDALLQGLALYQLPTAAAQAYLALCDLKQKVDGCSWAAAWLRAADLGWAQSLACNQHRSATGCAGPGVASPTSAGQLEPAGYYQFNTLTQSR